MLISSSVLAGISLVGGGLGAWSQIHQGQQQSKAARREAKRLEEQARLARENSRLQEAELHKQQIRFGASQNVAGAGMGVDLASDTFQLLKSEARASFEADRAQILKTGEYQAADLEKQARNLRKGGSNMTGAYLGAAGSLLSGVGGAMYYGQQGGWFV